jgi:hypothetical protein
MPNLLRYATLGAALFAGTAAAHSQTVIMQEPTYASPAYVAPSYVAPGYVAPGYVAAAPMIAPAPAVVAQPAPIPYVAQPTPMTQEIVTQPQTIVSQPAERMQETVIRRSASAPTAIHRSTRTTRVHLTSAQRHEVLHTIRYARTATPAIRQSIARTPVTYSVGSVLPPTVPTYTMPREVVYEAPALQRYAYAPVGDRVLLVEPASNVIVDELY